MKYIKMFIKWITYNRYSEESIQSELNKIQDRYSYLSELEIIKKKRQYLDDIDNELNEQLIFANSIKK